VEYVNAKIKTKRCVASQWVDGIYSAFTCRFRITCFRWLSKLPFTFSSSGRNKLIKKRKACEMEEDLEKEGLINNKVQLILHKICILIELFISLISPILW